MYRFLASRRWLVRILAGVLMVAACVWLGMWQLDRNEQRVSRNAVIEANADAPPAALADLVAAGRPVDPADQWRPVQVSGQYDRDHEFTLRLRPVGGEPGVHALTPLIMADGTAVLIDRGFLATPDQAATPPPPPSGTVEVIARLRTSEHVDGPVVAGSRPTIRYVDVGQISDLLPYPLVDGWAEVVEQVPPNPGLQPLPGPQAEAGPHLSYAVQWFLFACVGVGGFIALIRTEARARRGATADDRREVHPVS